MTALTASQKYILEKWPEVNKAAIQYDKERYHEALEKTKSRIKVTRVIPAADIPRGYIY